MSRVKIRGYDIEFPFEPYPTQFGFMNNVRESC